MTRPPLNTPATQERARREILHTSELIPPLPDFVVRLLALLNKPETEPRHLEVYMQNDQVLVARMLAMVNSPFYGLNRQVRTIKDAVMVLGFRGVRSLVLATSTAKFLQRDYSCYGHEPKGLWTHAAAVAAACRQLALQCRMSVDAAEQLFVAGLLHDIGKLVLVTPLDAARAVAAEGEDTVALEQRVIGVDHTEAGALVTAKWNLSGEVEEILKAHHDAGPSRLPAQVAVVRLADALAHERKYGYATGHAPRSDVQDCDLEALRLTTASWDALRDELGATMDAAVAALQTLTH